MAKKKISKKKSKLSENEKIAPKGVPPAQMASADADKVGKLKAEGELPKKKVREGEDRQLLWFFIVVGVIFVVFLVPYFWIQNSKTFEWGGADWVIEDDVSLDQLYHGRFMALDGANFYYNVWLRNDPRQNDVYTEGEFDSFKYGGYISFTRDIQNCNGEIPRARVDLESFLKAGLGVGVIENAAAEKKLAEEFNYSYVDCGVDLNRTVVVLKMGEPSVIQSIDNPNCYVITINDCQDNEPIEKFITKTIYDFNLKYN